MKKLMVVEDNAINRELLTEILTSVGYEVSQAMDGQEAVDMLSVERPDLVLLDLQMPRLDGRQTLQKIRQNPELDYLPVIACTASAMQGDREELMRFGFSGYISKPITIPDLLKSLNQF
jgi:CheY-like chemotaxis protein